VRVRLGVAALLALTLLAPQLAAPSEGQQRTPRVARGPLTTAFTDPPSLSGAEAPLALRRMTAAGATAIRIVASWRQVVPGGANRPPGFDAANPASPLYRWTAIDRQVRLASEAGLTVILSLHQGVPAWAERGGGGPPGTRNPDPAELGLFARAAAIRYGGSFGGLPRIRYWQIWNEPNLDVFLAPQYNGDEAVSPEIYRAMVNAAARAIHAVHADNAVLAGGLAPFGKPLSARVSFTAVSPLRFMREMLCMTGRTNPRPSCNATVEFDIWTHHPYTAGGPTKQAFNPDDASLGDLPEMRRLLEAAAAAGHVVSRQPLRFWVTEFSWDSNPPDPKGVPARLHARWVAEAMYRMWQAGVSLVTWFLLRDEPLGGSRNQSGLYLNSGGSYTNDRPKLALTAFRFPFVAFRSGARIVVWGRTPAGAPGTVRVEHRTPAGWTRLATLRANRHGIFTARLRPRFGRSGSLRARFAGSNSLAFSLAKPPDFRLQTPFGD
jgi:hypothetical protein